MTVPHSDETGETSPPVFHILPDVACFKRILADTVMVVFASGSIVASHRATVKSVRAEQALTVFKLLPDAGGIQRLKS